MLYIYKRIKPNSNNIALSHDSAHTKISRPVYQTPHSKSKKGPSPDTRTTSEDFGIYGNNQRVIENIYNIVDRMATAQDVLTKRIDKIEKEISLRF